MSPNWSFWKDESTNRKRADCKQQRPLICVGEDANNGEPLLLPIEAFTEGLFLYGPPGSGKTIQLAMLARQLALAGNASLSQGGPGASILLMDLKGDDYLYYHVLRETADELGIPFRVVTNETDHLATFCFNPLDSQMMPKLDAYARAEFVCGATGLLAGREYGKGWFSSATAELIFYAFKKYPRLRSFRECHKLLTEVLNAPKKIYQHEIHPEFVKSGLHALAVMGRLARLDALNATSRGDHAKLITDHNVDLADLFVRPQIVLFHLNTTKGLYTGPEIALMAAFSLIFGASSVTGERIQTFFLLDEASKAAHENLRHILEQCRSMQISTCLATQSLSALANKGVDLRDAVLTDERIRWWLGIPHPDEQRWFSTTAGERRVILEGISERRNWDGLDVTSSYSETVMPLYPINAVKTITSDPTLTLFELTRALPEVDFGGFPVIVRRLKLRDDDMWSRLKRTPWTDDQPGSFVPKTILPDDDPQFVSLAGPLDPLRIKRRFPELFEDDPDSESNS